MKISKKRLQKIIKEELEMANMGPKVGYNDAIEHQDNYNESSKEKLLRLATNALGLFSSLDENRELEPWVDAKVKMADNYISKIKKHLESEMQIEVPTPDMSQAIGSCNKEPEDSNDNNYAGSGNFYYNGQEGNQK